MKNPPLLVAIDLETTGLSRRDEIISAAVAWEYDGKIDSKDYYLSRVPPGLTSDMDLKTLPKLLRDLTARRKQDDREFQKVLRATLFNPDFQGKVIFHNLLFDMKLLLERYRPPQSQKLWQRFNQAAFGNSGNHGFYRFNSNHFCAIWDTQPISRIQKNNKFVGHIDPEKLHCHSLKYLEKEFFQEDFKGKEGPLTFEKVTGGRNARFSDLEDLLRYNRLDAEYTLRLYLKFKEALSEDEWHYVEKYEMPHILNLFHLNWHGTPFDMDSAKKLHHQLSDDIQKLESEVFRLAGQSFNIASNQDTASAIFNPTMTYQSDPNRPEVMVRPIYRTEGDSPAVDAYSLKTLHKRLREIDPISTALPLIYKILRYQEMTKNQSFLEILMRYAVPENGAHFLFPNMSANAVSGRVICSSPNLLGIPKKFFKQSDIPRDAPQPDPDGVDTESEFYSEFEAMFHALKDWNVRKTIRALPGTKLHSIDINGLDLTIIAHGAKKHSPPSQPFYWLNLFQSYRPEGGTRDRAIDSHYALLQRLTPERYRNAFSHFIPQLPDEIENYWVLKALNDSSSKTKAKGIEFLHKTTNKLIPLPFPDDAGQVEKELSSIRELSKKLTFATSYLSGPPGLAAKLTELELGGAIVPASEAQRLLDDFYSEEKGFPEVRKFQDEIANLVYEKGYAKSIFGRRFYCGTWDDLCEFERVNSKNLSPAGPESACQLAPYEFILQIKGRYWLVRAHDWMKEPSPVIQNLKIISRPFGFRFHSISLVHELDRFIFRPAPAELRKERAKIGNKSESQQEEKIKTELNRIAITDEVMRDLRAGSGLTTDGRDLLGQLLQEGYFFIPEQYIRYYRVHLQNPASDYFKEYTPLLRSAKAFFPMYCQGVAATIGKICLTRARKRIERETQSGIIHLFIHDQLVASAAENESVVMGEILTESIKNKELKLPFDLPFAGDLKLDKEFFSDLS